MGRVFITGDLHGSGIEFKNRIAQIDNPTEEDFIICAGDVGIEYDGYVYGDIKRAMKHFPGTVIVMRGNHDDCYWKNHGFVDNDGYYQFYNNGWEFVDNTELFIHQKKYPNIWYVDDNGGIYTINGYNILFIPGAYSVDKYYRLDNNYPWNPYEQLNDMVKEELYTIVKDWIDIGFDIDFVVGHTFPLKMEKYYRDLFMDNINQHLVDKSMEEWLDTIANQFERSDNFKQYFGGHFHDDRALTDKYTMLYHNVKDFANYVKET